MVGHVNLIDLDLCATCGNQFSTPQVCDQCSKRTQWRVLSAGITSRPLRAVVIDLIGFVL